MGLCICFVSDSRAEIYDCLCDWKVSVVFLILAFLRS